MSSALWSHISSLVDNDAPNRYTLAAHSAPSLTAHRAPSLATEPAREHQSAHSLDAGMVQTVVPAFGQFRSTSPFRNSDAPIQKQVRVSVPTSKSLGNPENPSPSPRQEEQGFSSLLSLFSLADEAPEEEPSRSVADAAMAAGVSVEQYLNMRIDKMRNLVDWRINDVSRVIQRSEQAMLQQLESERRNRQDSVAAVRQLLDTQKLIVEANVQDQSSRIDSVGETLASCFEEIKTLSMVSARNSDDILTVRTAHNERVLGTQTMQVRASEDQSFRNAAHMQGRIESIEQTLRSLANSLQAHGDATNLLQHNFSRVEAATDRNTENLQVLRVEVESSVLTARTHTQSATEVASLTSSLEKQNKMIDSVRGDVKLWESLLTDYVMQAKERADKICLDIEKMKVFSNPGTPRTLADGPSWKASEEALGEKLKQIASQMNSEQVERKDAIRRMQSSLNDFQTMHFNCTQEMSSFRSQLQLLPNLVSDATRRLEDEVRERVDGLSSLKREIGELRRNSADSISKAESVEVSLHTALRRLDDEARERASASSSLRQEIREIGEALKIANATSHDNSQLNAIVNEQLDNEVRAHTDALSSMKREIAAIEEALRQEIRTIGDALKGNEHLDKEECAPTEALSSIRREITDMKKRLDDEACERADSFRVIEESLKTVSSHCKEELYAIINDHLDCEVRERTNEISSVKRETAAIEEALRQEIRTIGDALKGNEHLDKEECAPTEALSSIRREITDMKKSLDDEACERADSFRVIEESLKTVSSHCKEELYAIINDHLDSEVRERTNEISSMRKEIVAIEEALKSATSQHKDNLDAIVTELLGLRATDSSKMESLEVSLGERLDSISSQLKQEENQRRESCEALRQDLERIPSMVRDTVSAEKDRIDNINELLQKLAPQLQAVEMSLKGQTSAGGPQDGRLDSVEGQLLALKQQQDLLLEPALVAGPQLRQLGESYANLEECLRKLEADYHGQVASADFQQLFERCDEMQEYIRKQEVERRVHEETTLAAGSQLQALGERYDELEEHVRKLEMESYARDDAFAVLEQSVGQSETLQNNINKERRRIDRLAPEIQALRADMLVYGSAYDALKADVQTLGSMVEKTCAGSIELNTSRLSNVSRALDTESTATFGVAMLEDIKAKHSGRSTPRDSVRGSSVDAPVSGRSSPSPSSPRLQPRVPQINLSSLVNSVAKEREQVDARIRELEGM